VGSGSLGLPRPALRPVPHSDDVKHETLGRSIKQVKAVHLDVELALVNVTVTDPYNRLVTGLEPDNFRISKTHRAGGRNFSAEDVPISIGVILRSQRQYGNKIG